jgi:uncharacterized membrane protein YphA (DoxX/SURF4 family)
LMGGRNGIEKLAQYGHLPIRILAGIAFIIHGISKLSNISGTEHFFSNMIGLPYFRTLIFSITMNYIERPKQQYTVKVL